MDERCKFLCGLTKLLLPTSVKKIYLLLMCFFIFRTYILWSNSYLWKVPWSGKTRHSVFWRKFTGPILFLYKWRFQSSWFAYCDGLILSCAAICLISEQVGKLRFIICFLIPITSFSNNKPEGKNNKKNCWSWFLSQSTRWLSSLTNKPGKSWRRWQTDGLAWYGRWYGFQRQKHSRHRLVRGLWWWLSSYGRQIRLGSMYLHSFLDFWKFLLAWNVTVFSCFP